MIWIAGAIIGGTCFLFGFMMAAIMSAAKDGDSDE